MRKRKHVVRGAGDIPGHLAGPRAQIRLVALVLGLAALAAVTFFLLYGKPIRAPSTMAPTVKGSAAGSGAQQEFEILSGRWQRLDGGYVLEIKSIEASGRMTTAYFNPRPINVSQAVAAVDEGAVKVFIELRDVNYPGATYHLTYDQGSDQLRGIYFQPALQQKFDIFFVRMK